MDCARFRQLYAQPLAERAGEALPGAWATHLEHCRGCGDWYQSEEVRRAGADPAGYPCVHLAYHAVARCQEHRGRPGECGEVALAYEPRFGEFGIVLGDGSRVLISHCPWCGLALPPSRRAAWFAKVEALPDGAEIPAALRTDAWWRA